MKKRIIFENKSIRAVDPGGGSSSSSTGSSCAANR